MTWIALGLGFFNIVGMIWILLRVIRSENMIFTIIHNQTQLIHRARDRNHPMDLWVIE